jgi:hypothetical protein
MRFVSFLIALCLTSVAYADEPTNPEAQAAFRAGASAYMSGKYLEASRKFSASYEREPFVDSLWGWAQSERLAGNCVTAMGLYHKYAREVGTARGTQAANEMIALCEKQLPAERTPWYKNKLGGGLGAGGVAGVAIGITFLALASSSRSAADEQMYLDDFEAKLDEATTRRRIGAVSISLGLAALGAGVTVYILHDRKQRSTLTAGTDGRVVFVGARF